MRMIVKQSPSYCPLGEWLAALATLPTGNKSDLGSAGEGLGEGDGRRDGDDGETHEALRGTESRPSKKE